jgi:hypothetical protein
MIQGATLEAARFMPLVHDQKVVVILVSVPAAGNNGEHQNMSAASPEKLKRHSLIIKNPRSSIPQQSCPVKRLGGRREW